MREIVLDTETTGLSPQDGHRIIEIGALEMINHVPTGATYHVYINPERPIDPDAMAVHGISDERVAAEPVFADLVDGFLSFIGDDPLVIHNAPFDMGFINAELDRCGKPVLPNDRAIDTLVMARKKFPGGQASLDALCRKFGIDNSHRELHGAMIDTDLLAEVYIELLGGKQPGLTLALNPQEDGTAPSQAQPSHMSPSHMSSGGEAYVAPNMAADNPNALTRAPRPHQASPEEQTTHQAFIQSMTDPLWQQYDESLKPPSPDTVSEEG